MKLAYFIILSLLPVAFSEKLLASDSNSEENVRVKRAGFSLISGAIQSLQKSAFSASASLSAGSSAQSSGSSGHSASGSSSSSHDSSSHSFHSHEYEEPQHHDTKPFDGWQLKKSILNTLLQAVKAIAGGVTTLKGQLIKGSGYLVSQKGKLIASAGDSVSDAGKSIINSAHLIKPEDSGHGQSIGHSLGSKFGGLTSTLTKSISSLSAGSAGSISSLSSSSSAHGSGSSSSHGESYTQEENHGSGYSYNLPESNNYGGYDTKPETYGPPKIIESYGPPRPAVYFQEPQSAYGTPEYHDGSFKSSSNHQEASYVLDDILRNLPHKPMKSVGYESYSGGQSLNQLPNPNNPPPFKPLDSYSFNVPFEGPKSIQSNQYGPPLNSFSDYHGQSSNKMSVAVNPKAYDIYHTMKIKMTKDKNFVTIPPTNVKGLEIQKSIQYEIKA